MQPMKAEKGNVARFTREEKAVLFSLFQEYEEFIDIKHRKNSTPKKTCDVRRCWQIILDSYNNDPQVKTLRSLKQLQKFWLNSRLRKRYPSVALKDEPIANASTPSPTQPNGPPPLKSRPFPEQKIKTMAATKENYKYDFQIISQQDENDDSKTKVQQVSIDTISTDNLSLNDLLEFKNSSHTEIIELKPLHINRSRTNESTLENDQDHEVEPIMYEEGDDCEEEEPDPETIAVIEAVGAPEASFNHKQREINCCCTHRNHSEHHSDYSATIDDRLNMYRIKEAEFKYKEQQLRYVRQKMELTKTREELRHARELHRLQIQEMKTKLNILAEEEKKLMSVQ